jgi:DMSO/TMAO reductase YedYZ molybdopterin-dependent catalytic subunit
MMKKEFSSRRELLKLAPLAGFAALAFPEARRHVLASGMRLTDAAGQAALRTGQRAEELPAEFLTPLDKFPVTSYLAADPGVDLARWTLSVEGAVARPGEYTLAQLRQLPRVSQNTRHVCIEGWDVAGNFGGVRLRDFLAWVGVDPRARYLEIECEDDYYETLDLESALHPQSLLCDAMYGAPLTPEHGAPLRLTLPTKLGYKQPKYIHTLRATAELGSRRGYWVDRGYSWYGGL